MLFYGGNIGARCIYSTSNFEQNGPSDQPFPITFSKKENIICVQKVAILANLERFFEKFQSVAKLKPFFLLLPSKPPQHSHARARRVILANARIEHHFKIQIGYFGYCRIPLSTEKITILPIYFCKREGLTRLWRNLLTFLKIAKFNPFFLMKAITSKP